MLRELVAVQRAGVDVVLATRIEDGAQALVRAEAARGLLGVAPEVVAAAVRSGQPRTVETSRGAVFVRPYLTPPRLIVVGAVHIAQALAPMAAMAGFRVTVIDPREGFAAASRFPQATLLRKWPDDAMAALGLDARTGVAALTHDPRIDDPALAAALNSPAFYVGALGSRKTQAARRSRLREAGFGAAELARIRGPIGLPIGAATPEEIAVAVLAEAISALRGGSGS